MALLTQAQSIEELSFEEILQKQKTWLIARDANLADVVNIESETITKLIENFAYRELYLRQRINNGIKATMVATASGSDLDNLLLLFGVERLTIVPANDTTTPPTIARLEDDVAYRKRGLLVLESFSTAGPKLGYEYHGLSVINVHDIIASSPSNGVVDIKVMSETGQASDALLEKVSSALNDEKVRPMATQLIVESATAVDYQIQATLELDDTPASALALDAAKTAVDNYVVSRFKIGKSVSISSIYAALQQTGVENVALISPTANVVINNTQFANCTDISIG